MQISKKAVISEKNISRGMLSSILTGFKDCKILNSNKIST
jgi:hypothetical protein